MAWSIYGTPLQPGHCEVHPDVAQEYPCFVCIAEPGPIPTFECCGSGNCEVCNPNFTWE